MSSHFTKLALLLVGITSVAHAQLYIAEGRSSGVLAHFNFTIDPVANTLTVAVDNTHAGTGGVEGVVTSFGFNVPDSLIASASLTSQTWTLLTPGRTEPADWSITHSYGINVGGNNYGQDAGVITGPNPNGGNPPKGIWFGEKVTFVFQFADFSPLEIVDFLGEDGVTARWQALENIPSGVSDSDVGFGNPGDSGGPLPPVPEPSTYALFGSLVLLLGVAVRRYRAVKTVARQ